MATFTNATTISGLSPTTVNSTVENIQLAPDVRRLSSAQSQQTIEIDDAGPTAALENQLVHQIG